MPAFEIKDPSGNKYRINTPEGMSQDRAIQLFNQEYSAGRIKPAEAKPAEKPVEKYPSGVPKQGPLETAITDAIKGAGKSLLERGKRDVGAVAELGTDVLKGLPKGLVNFGTRGQTAQQEMLGIQPDELAPHQRPGATRALMDKALPPTGRPGEMIGEALGDPSTYMMGRGGAPSSAPGVAISGAERAGAAGLDAVGKSFQPPPSPFAKFNFPPPGGATSAVPDAQAARQAAARATTAPAAPAAPAAEAEGVQHPAVELLNAFSEQIARQGARQVGGHVGHALGHAVGGPVGGFVGSRLGRTVGGRLAKGLTSATATAEKSEAGDAAAQAWKQFESQRLARTPTRSTETAYNPTTTKGGAPVRGKATQSWTPGNTVDVGFTKNLLVKGKNPDGSITLLAKPDKSGMSQAYSYVPHQGLAKEGKVPFTEHMPAIQDTPKPGAMYDQ